MAALKKAGDEAAAWGYTAVARRVPLSPARQYWQVDECLGRDRMPSARSHVFGAIACLRRDRMSWARSQSAHRRLKAHEGW
jgi:hypothetical protein